MERTLELTSQGRRVWWAGLPSQRSYVYRLATRQGALVGLEFQTLQQVYYRLLAHARRLRPLVVGTGRLALVGEALAEEQGGLPSPGEARLFAGAVAEAKRFGVKPADLPEGDPEVDRFRAIFLAYERLKGDAWDYDDFRIEALRLAEDGLARPEADALIVDGFRELSPLDLSLLSLIGDSCEVRLALAQAPTGYQPAAVLQPRPGQGPCVYSAPNPVSEARWVLNSLKRDLACGFDPLELAVILPRGESVAFSALADEYGVPTMDESPLSLADSRPGRLLLELLELPDYPTASRLLPIRELAPLADAAIEEGVAGHEALARLAERLGLLEIWRRWQARLEVPQGEANEGIDEWAADLVELALRLAAGEPDPPHRFREQALLRAKEAQRVATGDGFRAWWAALLGDTSISSARRGGVHLLDERQASGRRFRKAYLMHANEGSFGTGEREDYFVPEEQRLPLERLLKGAERALPRRFAGRDTQLFDEMLQVADEVIVTFSSGDQSGRRMPETALTAGAPQQPLPLLPVGSPLELTVGESYRAPSTMTRSLPATSEPISLERLRRYDECPMRYWLEGLLERPERRGAETDDWWRSLRRDLMERTKTDDGQLEVLAQRYPEAAEWLRDQRELLLGLSFGVRLTVIDEAVFASLDAAVTEGSEALIYVFAPPGSVRDEASARDLIEDRWTELWAAGHMLEQYRSRVKKVRLFTWPLLGEPIEVYQGGIRSVWRRIDHRRTRAHSALAKMRSGSIAPAPGYRCNECPVRDVCREGAR